MKVSDLGTISPNFYTNLYNKFYIFNRWVPYLAPFLARTNIFKFLSLLAYLMRRRR